MTAEHRTAELANARTEQASARTEYDRLSQVRDTKRAAWRKAVEALEFWNGKIAFLTHAR